MAMHLNDTQGRLAVLTGRSGGIGLAIAEQLAARGFKLLLVARNERKLEIAGAAIKERYSVEIHTASIDVGDSDALKQLPEKVRSIAPGEKKGTGEKGERPRFLGEATIY